MVSVFYKALSEAVAETDGSIEHDSASDSDGSTEIVLPVKLRSKEEKELNDQRTRRIFYTLCSMLIVRDVQLAISSVENLNASNRSF